MNFVPQLYNCLLEIRSPSTEIKGGLKKIPLLKKTQPNNGGASKYRCFLGFKLSKTRPMATWTGPQIFFWWKEEPFQNFFIYGQAAYSVVDLCYSKWLSEEIPAGYSAISAD